jgi:hypothetical protein
MIIISGEEKLNHGSPAKTKIIEIIDDDRLEMNEGVEISIIADGYISLKRHLVKTPELLDGDHELQSRLAFLKTEIIDRGGASYFSEGI